MHPRFGEMQARSMRDATEMNARWRRDGCEIWRDAGLYKISQFSRNLSKSQETILSGGFLRSGMTGSHDSARLHRRLRPFSQSVLVNVNLVNRRVNLHVNLAIVQNPQCLCGLLTC